MGKKISPYILILLSFILIILIGTLLLMQKFALNSGETITFLDSLFTATSAVSVTGLVVNDVSLVFNDYGKIIILILIQLGGLGILTFSSMLVLLISRKIGYFTKKLVQEDLNHDNKFDIYKYIKNVAKVVFIIEFLGSFFLFFEFIKKYQLKKAIFYSIFHSISAFCNAGFSLFSNNLESFTSNVNINIIISFLIIFGGLGFAAIIDLFSYILRKNRRLTINTKFSISITISLIIIGMLLFLSIEYNNILYKESFFNKLLISYFQSVSTRTAGFNTVSLSNLYPATIIIMSILMFVGASPGSTGGGIKTNTVGIIFLGIKTFLLNKKDIEYSKRRISVNTYNKATTLFIIAFLYTLIILILISIFESNINFLDLVFEVFSAIGTVGLSTGITSSLSIYSKILIIVTMFLGRVGPLTVVFAISKFKSNVDNYKLPEENILIG